ncbi:MAG: hypothetical protein IJE26_04180 [Oscillospiraceae bacterium]|nr:hypothetical protein [Oscillospiraceae bacterium]
MELYKEILGKALEQERMEIYFPELRINAAEIVAQRCYRALKEISDVIRDDSLSDRECYQKIEAIIQTFEALGSNGGSRHDE